MLIMSSTPEQVRVRMARLMKIPSDAVFECQEQGRYIMVPVKPEEGKKTVTFPEGWEMISGVAYVTLNGYSVPSFFGPGDAIKTTNLSISHLKSEDDIYFKVFVDGFSHVMAK